MISASVADHKIGEGTWGIRHSTARRSNVCSDCHNIIRVGETYWRRYGTCHDSCSPFIIRTCDGCEERWFDLYGGGINK